MLFERCVVFSKNSRPFRSPMRAVTDGPGRRSRKLSRSAVKPSTRNTRPRSRNRCCVHCARRQVIAMFERFSAQARGVVVDAVAGSGPVTPMELLTALLTSDRGIATEVLTESGVTLDVIRHAAPDRTKVAPTISTTPRYSSRSASISMRFGRVSSSPSAKVCWTRLLCRTRRHFSQEPIQVPSFTIREGLQEGVGTLAP